LRDEVEETVNTEIRRREYLMRGMDAAAIREVEQTYAPFASLNPRKETGQEAVNATDIIKQWAPSAFVYLLWVAIVQMLLNNIIEEKSNRIIEVLLSSVTPGELMMGKLFGIAAVGLTMVGSWMLALVGILLWKSGGVSGAAGVTGQMLTVLHSSSLIPMFCVYFLLGYIMYASCILALGSVCNTLKEAQSYMGVITMIMMVPLLTMTFIPKDPNGVLARVLSWIPLYTPFIMMNRAMADPPLIDLIGTMVLLLVATGGGLWMAGRVFRIGILRTGQPPKFLEMLRWLKR
jgi:ABC-2 type transport system permease protein